MSLLDKNFTANATFPNLEKALDDGQPQASIGTPEARIKNILGVMNGSWSYPRFPSDIGKSMFPRQIREISRRMEFLTSKHAAEVTVRQAFEALLTGHFLMEFWSYKPTMHGSEAIDLAQRSLCHAPLSRYFGAWFPTVTYAFKSDDITRDAIRMIGELITASIETGDPYLFVNVDFLEHQAEIARMMASAMGRDERMGIVNTINEILHHEVTQANAHRG